MSEIAPALLEHVRKMCADPYWCTRVAVYAGLQGDAAGGIDCSIHPDDQMLLHSLRHHQDANAAFSQYFNVGLQQYRAFRQVYSLLGIDRRPGAAVLDFACGYGRLLRFLSPTFAEGAIWAAEIQPEALAFVRDRFRVKVVPSAYEPGAFQPGRSFDLIWVASLFSHLPGRLFHAWLARLKDCVSESGAICFSVHGTGLLPAGESMPPEGISFRPFSENADLDADAYGTTYVTEHYVREAVRTVCGAQFDCRRIPRGLAHEQDLYVIARSGELDLDALKGFRYGPWGWVDERRITRDGQLFLRGWAASLDDGPLRQVDIRVNGAMHACATGMPREDVERVFGERRLAGSGWIFTLQLGRPAELRVEVAARDARGEAALLYAGVLHPEGSDTGVQAPRSEMLSLGRRAAARLRVLLGFSPKI
ncbi:hypothetical protein B4966_12800 [Rhodocyclaceae bacterium]|nr:hypothetical protein B4966_12800 [Rhodocyclaceae bacterium]